MHARRQGVQGCTARPIDDLRDHPTGVLRPALDHQDHVLVAARGPDGRGGPGEVARAQDVEDPQRPFALGHVFVREASIRSRALDRDVGGPAEVPVAADGDGRAGDRLARLVHHATGDARGAAQDDVAEPDAAVLGQGSRQAHPPGHATLRAHHDRVQLLGGSLDGRPQLEAPVRSSRGPRPDGPQLRLRALDRPPARVDRAAGHDELPAGGEGDLDARLRISLQLPAARAVGESVGLDGDLEPHGAIRARPIQLERGQGWEASLAIGIGPPNEEALDSLRNDVARPGVGAPTGAEVGAEVGSIPIAGHAGAGDGLAALAHHPDSKREARADDDLETVDPVPALEGGEARPSHPIPEHGDQQIGGLVGTDQGLDRHPPVGIDETAGRGATDRPLGHGEEGAPRQAAPDQVELGAHRASAILVERAAGDLDPADELDDTDVHASAGAPHLSRMAAAIVSLGPLRDGSPEGRVAGGLDEEGVLLGGRGLEGEPPPPVGRGAQHALARALGQGPDPRAGQESGRRVQVDHRAAELRRGGRLQGNPPRLHLRGALHRLGRDVHLLRCGEGDRERGIGRRRRLGELAAQPEPAGEERHERDAREGDAVGHEDSSQQGRRGEGRGGRDEARADPIGASQDLGAHGGETPPGGLCEGRPRGEAGGQRLAQLVEAAVQPHPSVAGRDLERPRELARTHPVQQVHAHGLAQGSRQRLDGALDRRGELALAGPHERIVGRPRAHSLGIRSARSLADHRAGVVGEDPHHPGHQPALPIEVLGALEDGQEAGLHRVLGLGLVPAQVPRHRQKLRRDEVEGPTEGLHVAVAAVPPERTVDSSVSHRPSLQGRDQMLRRFPQTTEVRGSGGPPAPDFR